MEGGHIPAGYNGVDSMHGSHAIGHPHGSTNPAVQTIDAEKVLTKGVSFEDSSSQEAFTDSSEAKPVGAQIMGVAILEFGVVFHSVGGQRRMP
jgi:hypothetical protein